MQPRIQAILVSLSPIVTTVRWAGLTICLNVACLSFASVGLAAGPSAAEPRTHVLATRTFTLPVDVPTDPGGSDVQFQLLVSDGNGWRVSQTIRPPARHFEFQGDRDGAYEFAVRTVDRLGQPHPGSDPRAGMKIIVDTQGPQIKLSADADFEGRVRGQSLVRDPRGVKAIQVQYFCESDSQWRVLPDTEVSADGRFQFTPAQDWRRLVLRVDARDGAGNDSAFSITVQRPRTASRTPRSRLASDRQGSTDNKLVVKPAGVPITFGLTTTGGQPETLPTPVGQLPAPAEEVPTPAGQPTTMTLPEPATPEDISRATVGGRPDVGLNPPQGNDSFGGEASESAPKWQPSSPSPSSPWDPSAVMTGPRSVEQALRPLSRPVDPEESSQRTQSQRPPAPASVAEQLGPGLPELDGDDLRAFRPEDSRAPVRYSDSLRFSLEYELEAVGSNGVEAIELWGSTDVGQSWKRWGEDPDRSSPFDIETKEEGVFGFRIVVMGANGLNTPVPRSGESADITVVVDRSKPKVQITKARYGEGDATGCLVIGYLCEDLNLSQRPISLAFAPTADGPWTTIAGGLRNDGDYIWPADPGLPQQMFLRITATDLAGNVGSHQLDKPIDTQGLAPRARIRGFQPLSGTIAPTARGEQTATRARAVFK